MILDPNLSRNRENQIESVNFDLEPKSSFHQRSANKPSLYFAGKISKNCYRNDLVPCLRGADFSRGPIETETFWYSGPFFVSCNHGCRHGDSSHGVLGIGCQSDITDNRRSIFLRNQSALESSDIVFAYIDAADCYGTLIELGWAYRSGISILLVFAPTIDHRDFWYAQQLTFDAPSNVIIADRANLSGLLNAFLVGRMSK